MLWILLILWLRDAYTLLPFAVVRRAPHEFKIACLEDIKALFPSDRNPFPFYAGFGNRHTDEISYLKVGIPKGKIFTINPKGQIVVNRHIDTKSYTSLHSLVTAMFPAIFSCEQEDFNLWNFWRLPPPYIDWKLAQSILNNYFEIQGWYSRGQWEIQWKADVFIFIL